MTLKAFGIDFEVTVPFALLIAFLLISDRTGLMTASLSAMIVHEAGHIIAMKLLKCAPRFVKLQLGGILIVSGSFYDFAQNVLVAVSGPAANFIAVCISLPFALIYGSMTFLSFAAVQFIIGALNLLPVKGLDGGTVLSAVLEKICKKNTNFFFTCISVLFSAALFILGVAVAVKNTDNPTLLLLGIYLIILNIIKR